MLPTRAITPPAATRYTAYNAALANTSAPPIHSAAGSPDAERSRTNTMAMPAYESSSASTTRRVIGLRRTSDESTTTMVGYRNSTSRSSAAVM